MISDIQINKVTELINNNKYEQAKEVLNDILDNDENDIEAKKLYALCEVNIGNYNEARYILEDVVKFKNDDALSWYYLGCCYDNLENFISAKHAYLRVIELREEYIDAYKNLAITYIKMEDFNNAIEIMLTALNFCEDDYSVYYILGTAYMALQDSENSLKYLNKALDLEPNNVQLHNNLGTSYLSIGNYEKAIESYEKVLEIDENDSLAYFNIASILQIKNEHKKACDYFAKAYNLEPSDNYIVAWAISEVKAGLLTEAIEHYKYLSSMYPQSTIYKYNLACCCFAAGEYQLAIALLKQLVTMCPKDIKMLKKLAEVYTQTGNFIGAKEIYEKLVKQGTISYLIYYQLATLCIKTGDIDRAETMLKKSCSLKPDFAIAHKDLGVIYLNKRLFDYAKDEFETAYNIDNKNYSIVLEYANYLHAVSDFEQADKKYEEAYKLSPDSPMVLAFSALNKTHLKDIEEAKNRINKVMKKHIHSAFLFFIAGRIYFLDNDFEMAKMYLIKAFEMEKLPDVESLLAQCYIELGNYEQAKNILENMHQKFSLNTNITLNLAKCYERLNLNENARLCAEEIVSVVPECEEAQEIIRRNS